MGYNDYTTSHTSPTTTQTIKQSNFNDKCRLTYTLTNHSSGIYWITVVKYENRLVLHMEAFVPYKNVINNFQLLSIFLCKFIVKLLLNSVDIIRY